MPAGIHEGHRGRLKDRFVKSGLDGFQDHNVLELLLFYAIPQRDTNELAHLLMKEFGSLNAVFDADFQDLCNVKGIGQNTAVLIKMIPDLARRYLEGCTTKTDMFTEIAQIGDFLRPKFVGRTNEMVFLLCLDNKGGIVYADFIAEGAINAAPIYVRPILETAMRSRAVSVILAHNHPSGLALPSAQDLQATQTVYKALETAKIRLMDHFVFAGDDYVSLRDSGYFSFLPD